MIGLTDGIELADVLASPGSRALLPVQIARQSAFKVGDRVRHLLCSDPPGTVIGVTKKMFRVRWDNFKDQSSTYLPVNLAHVEPSASVEATLSGEANP